MKRITIEFIDHHKHRYDTAGDYYRVGPGRYRVLASRMGDWRYDALLAFHELAEFLLVKHAKISDATITRWDKEMARKFPDAEPGEFKEAPYHKQHMLAEHLERLLAIGLGVKWSDYGKAFLSLWQPHREKNVRPVTKK